MVIALVFRFAFQYMGFFSEFLYGWAGGTLALLAILKIDKYRN